MNSSMKGNLMLTTTAIIWGMSFVAQRVGAQLIGAFAFNGIRFALGGLSLIPLLLFLDRKTDRMTVSSAFKKALPAGFIMGSVLFCAAALQQIGIKYTTAGNSAFITGLYIILVPFLSVFLKRHIERKIWVAGTVAVIGLYLMTVDASFQVNSGDLITLAGSFFWATHILLVDHFVRKYNVLKLTILQFFCCSLLSLAAAAAFETTTSEMVQSAWIPIAYGGLMSVGIAYTLQMFGQRTVNPSLAAIILSFEIVFAALGAAWLLSETFNARGYAGAFLIFIGILISQLRIPLRLKTPASS